MRFFLDSVNIDEIKKAVEIGVIEGVTTNPSLISKGGGDFKKTIQEIASIVNGPVHVEPIGTTYSEIMKEADEYRTWADNISIKIPATIEGLKCINDLSNKGIKTTVTLVFNINQALLAARAGASYICPFIGRLDDIDIDGISAIAGISEVYAIHDIRTEIVAASIRTVRHVEECALAGVDIITVPYNIIEKMMAHPLTEKGIEKFLADWKKK